MLKLEYRGFTSGPIKFAGVDDRGIGVFCGAVEGLNEVGCFYGATDVELKLSFQKIIDVYLDKRGACPFSMAYT